MTTKQMKENIEHYCSYFSAYPTEDYKQILDEQTDQVIYFSNSLKEVHDVALACFEHRNSKANW